jgi:hypothetical protein
MIFIIHTERSHIVTAFLGLAILFTLIGWFRHQDKLDNQAAEVVRNWHEVNRMEAQLDRFDQVIAAYDGIKPIPLKSEVSGDG